MLPNLKVCHQFWYCSFQHRTQASRGMRLKKQKREEEKKFSLGSFLTWGFGFF